jgi:hypothetical protein
MKKHIVQIKILTQTKGNKRDEKKRNPGSKNGKQS